MTLNRMALGLLLALAMLLAQQLGALHRLSHAVDAVTGQHEASGCDGCLAWAGLDKPAPASVPTLASPAAGAPALAPAPDGASPTRAPRMAYRSRAPPAPG